MLTPEQKDQLINHLAEENKQLRLQALQLQILLSAAQAVGEQEESSQEG